MRVRSAPRARARKLRKQFSCKVELQWPCRVPLVALLSVYVMEGTLLHSIYTRLVTRAKPYREPFARLVAGAVGATVVTLKGSVSEGQPME